MATIDNAVAQDILWISFRVERHKLSERKVKEFLRRVTYYQKGGKVELEEARNRAFSSLGFRSKYDRE
ncbi:MAG: hypothetical protein KAI07_00635 [Deltaproteobacteria bacterium]|nr:hypothetical protein [Deltaproteobacteria bacterium]